MMAVMIMMRIIDEESNLTKYDSKRAEQYNTLIEEVTARIWWQALAICRDAGQLRELHQRWVLCHRNNISRHNRGGVCVHACVGVCACTNNSDGHSNPCSTSSASASCSTHLVTDACFYMRPKPRELGKSRLDFTLVLFLWYPLG